MSDEQLNDANREFEQIKPTMSDAFVRRLIDGFQVRTISPALSFIGSTAYSSPGSVPNQIGPTPMTNVFLGGMNGVGDPGSVFLGIINNLPNPTVPNPGTEPPVGPEERLRYSCLSGKCIQDPNGAYYGIDECLADGCTADSGGGSNNTVRGCDCGYGPLHTLFKAQITGITCAAGGLTYLGRTYWTYSWTEINPIGTARSSSNYGDALNEFERSMPNNGGSTPPATSLVSRLRIPDNAIVPMMIDLTGAAWFCQSNPLSVSCTANFDAAIDGGEYFGLPS